MRVYILVVLIAVSVKGFSQAYFNPDSVSPKEFDYGKMWTFDDPPLEYFAETYDFNPDSEWMKGVQLSTLRLSSGCSASFISENGLILTNHHCARGAAVLNTTEEEDVVNNGYISENRQEERKLKGFYADQLVRIVDVTEEVSKGLASGKSYAEVEDEIKGLFQGKKEWEGLTLQVLNFYSGGKYSLYGFKRYTDIRLVLIPEEQLGFFGGDPDNFTYPRYALDCAFLRAYDEKGQPLNTGSNFFPLNPDGIKENEPVFVVGNPGSTGRFRTMAQLRYDRDRRVPISLQFFRSRMNILRKYNLRLDSDSLANVIFSLSNAEKSYGGQLDGLNNTYFMTRKLKLEERNRNQILAQEKADYWSQIETNSKGLGAIAAETRFLNPYSNFPINGKIIQVLHLLKDYSDRLSDSRSENRDLASATKARIGDLTEGMDMDLEEKLFTNILEELQAYSNAQPSYIQRFLAGTSPIEKTKQIMGSPILKGSSLPTTKGAFLSSKDALVEAALVFPMQYQKAVEAARELNSKNEALEQQIIKAQFAVNGSKSPPDATFSLRISDGIVKGYRYNGTIAPYQTTYFGMYDRYYSNNKMLPWDLPTRWHNPPLDLLASPLNFVATFDTIGGNSGSPVINRNRELVGLNFDSNIDRLPVRNIMYDPAYGRSVGVHAGGIYAALKYIYSADNILSEIGVD